MYEDAASLGRRGAGCATVERLDDYCSPKRTSHWYFVRQAVSGVPC